MLRIGVIVTKLALCLQPTAAGDTIGVQRPAVSRSFSDSPSGPAAPLLPHRLPRWLGRLQSPWTPAHGELVEPSATVLRQAQDERVGSTPGTSQSSCRVCLACVDKCRHSPHLNRHSRGSGNPASVKPGQRSYRRGFSGFLPRIKYRVTFFRRNDGLIF